jgi:uncharacterized protein (DUF2141 family)
VDEEEYAKLVETRRNAGDFVVDDGISVSYTNLPLYEQYALTFFYDLDGNGYHDDGEEHIGIAEDASESKSIDPYNDVLDQ